MTCSYAYDLSWIIVYIKIAGISVVGYTYLDCSLSGKPCKHTLF